MRPPNECVLRSLGGIRKPEGGPPPPEWSAISVVRGCPRGANALQTLFQYGQAYRHELFIAIPAVCLRIRRVRGLVITAEIDVPRNEGEAYGRKLWNAFLRAAVDTSLIKADASRQKGVEGSQEETSYAWATHHSRKR